MNSNEYYNAIGGRELYSKEAFSKYGIKLSFIESKTEAYNQFGNTFYPNLSIIDLLMFNSRDKISKMLKQYAIV